MIHIIKHFICALIIAFGIIVLSATLSSSGKSRQAEVRSFQVDLVNQFAKFSAVGAY